VIVPLDGQRRKPSFTVLNDTNLSAARAVKEQKLTIKKLNTIKRFIIYHLVELFFE